MTDEIAVPPAERFAALDMLRGLALFGVLMVNLLFEFRVSVFQQFIPGPASASTSDRVIGALVSDVFEMKAFAIFSLLFGIGLGIQFDRFAKHGGPSRWLVRRLLVLLAFGLVHLLLLWNGDILTEYAIAGLLVVPLLRLPRAVLALVAAAAFGLYLAEPFLPLPLALPGPGALQKHVQLANAVYSQGGWWEIRVFSAGELNALFPLLAWVLPRTLAFFVLGVVVWRSGLVQRLPCYKAPLLAAGLLLVASGALLEILVARGTWSDQPAARSVADNLSPILLALGYAALFGCAFQVAAVRSLFSPLAPLGRMAFSNYIAQSVVLGFIFYGYGLGAFGRTSLTAAGAIGVSLYALQMIVSALWLRAFRFGPLEWLWRTLTYGTPQPMRRLS